MKILIYHTLEDSLGGAELVLIHIMNHFLKDAANTVTVLGFKAPDIDKMESFSGLSLARDRIFSAPMDIPSFMEKLPSSIFLVKSALLQRKAKAISKDYDLCVSSCGEVDFGRRGIQYIHMPVFAPYPVLQRYRIIHDTSLLNRYPWASRPYHALVNILAGNSRARIESNCSLTNSRFMRGVISESYNITADVVYPSLFDLSGLKPAAGTEKKMRISCVGRIGPDKGTLDLMDYFAAIHKRCPDLEIVAAGKVSDTAYYAAVRARADELGVPVVFMTDIPRKDIEDVLKSSLFSINPKQYEHFGIATLEAMAAGCLPLIHKSGGSVEIVPAEELQFTDANDLAQKVERLVANPSLRSDISKQLENALSVFSLERFYREFDDAVKTFMAQERNGNTIPAKMA